MDEDGRCQDVYVRTPELVDVYKRQVPARAPEGPLPGLMLRAQDISLKRRGAPGPLCALSLVHI